METVFERRTREARETQRNILRGTARNCRGYGFALAWKGMFPFKAAEELSARSGQSLRTAAYQISGEVEPSYASITALVVEAGKEQF